jgi:hypothetical protein
MSKKKVGPWDTPLKNYIKEFKLAVIIYIVADDSIENEFEIDYGNHEDRKFLGRITFWAVNNGRSIETMSLENWKAIK